MVSRRHPKYEKPQDMQSTVDAYFKGCEFENRTPTIEEFRLVLGFTATSLANIKIKKILIEL